MQLPTSTSTNKHFNIEIEIKIGSQAVLDKRFQDHYIPLISLVQGVSEEITNFCAFNEKCCKKYNSKDLGRRKF